MRRSLIKAAVASCFGLAAVSCQPSYAVNLGIEGQVFEIIEEDLRITLMRMVARHDWQESQDELVRSAQNYTKNLPPLYLPPAQTTKTVWKDVGIVLTEDIEVPYVDWETGSVTEPGRVIALQAGTYLNPIQHLPAAGIDRLFVFDGLIPEQLSFAKELMRQKIPQMAFMAIAGDVGEMAKDMNMPVYYPAPTMLEKFHITHVPTLVGFGKGPHHGHMALTAFSLPTTKDTVLSAWYGLPYEGYDPYAIPDFERKDGPRNIDELAAEAAYVMDVTPPAPPASN